MSGWSYNDGQYPSCSYNPQPQPHYSGQNQQQATPGQTPAPAQPSALPEKPDPFLVPSAHAAPSSIKGSNPRESRNKAEKQRRDRMSQSIARLTSILPPLAGFNRKIDKTSVLRLTAHYIRSHKHVFGDTLYRAPRGPQFGMNFTRTFLRTMKGFVITVTYKGLIVVVSPNIQEYLGYTEVELLGQSFFNMIHPDDHLLLRKQLLPTSCRLTTNGELFLTKEPDAAIRAAEELKKEKRSFIVRIKKQTHLRSEPPEYTTCHIEGSFRKSDAAGVFVDRVVQIGRRVRSRGNNPYASGNDIVFVGMVRPITDSFLNESKIEGFKMEYRTRHSIDGKIIQCEHRISLITGYMTHEVNGTNAMNFMHRDDVHWVIVALREMYDQRRLSGESCYRLMTKNGEFIYMRTKGDLDVDPKTQEVTSFVCVNTLVTEEEGKKLIQEMKNKFSMIVKNEKPKPDIESKLTQIIEKPAIPVEDPRQLEKVICHLVTDLPSLKPDETVIKDSTQKIANPRLAIIPPKREQIAKAIEKSYSVIKTLRNTEMDQENLLDADFISPFSTPPSSPELPRHENVHVEQIYQQPAVIPQFFLENQDFLPQLAGVVDWVIPPEMQPAQAAGPLPLAQLARAAVPAPLVQLAAELFEQPVEAILVQRENQRPLMLPIGQPFFPLFPDFQLQQILPLELIDPNLPMQQYQIDEEEVIPQLYQEEQPVALFQEEQPVALIQEEQPVALIHEEQPVALIQEEQPVALIQEVQPVALIQEEQPVALIQEEQPVALIQEVQPVAVIQDAQMVMPLQEAQLEEQVLAELQNANTDAGEKEIDDLVRWLQTERAQEEIYELALECVDMFNSNIDKDNNGRQILSLILVNANDFDIISDNESQIILNGEENVAADLNRIENNPIQNIPGDNGINQNSSAAPQESTSYDPYVFVDEEEPICSYFTFLSRKSIKRRY